MYVCNYGHCNNSTIHFSYDEQVSKIAIDLLSAQELSDELLYSDVPKCMVTIFADDNATSNLSYSVPIDGIIEEEEINVIAHLDSSSSEGMLSYFIINVHVHVV